MKSDLEDAFQVKLDKALASQEARLNSEAEEVKVAELRAQRTALGKQSEVEAAETTKDLRESLTKKFDEDKSRALEQLQRELEYAAAEKANIMLEEQKVDLQQKAEAEKDTALAQMKERLESESELRMNHEMNKLQSHLDIKGSEQTQVALRDLREQIVAESKQELERSLQKQKQRMEEAFSEEKADELSVQAAGLKAFAEEAQAAALDELRAELTQNLTQEGADNLSAAVEKVQQETAAEKEKIMTDLRESHENDIEELQAGFDIFLSNQKTELEAAHEEKVARVIEAERAEAQKLLQDQCTQQQMTFAEEKAQALREMRAALESSNTEHLSAAENMANSAKAMALAEQKAKLEEEFTASRMEALEQMKSDLEDAFQVKINSARSIHENGMDAERESHKAALAQQKLKLEAEAQTSQATAVDECTERMKSAHAKEMEKALQELQNSLSEDAGASLQKSLAAQKQQMQHDAAADKQTALEGLESKLKADFSQSQEEALSNLRTDLVQKHEEAMRKLEDSLSESANSNQQNSLKDLEERLNAEAAQKQAQALSDLTNSLTTKLEGEKAQALAVAKNTGDKAQQKAIEALRTEMSSSSDASLSKLRAELQMEANEAKLQMEQEFQIEKVRSLTLLKEELTNKSASEKQSELDALKQSLQKAAEADLQEKLQEAAMKAEAEQAEVLSALRSEMEAKNSLALEQQQEELRAEVAASKQSVMDLEMRLGGVMGALESEKAEVDRVKDEMKKAVSDADKKAEELQASILCVNLEKDDVKRNCQVLEAEIEALKEAQGATEKQINDRISAYTREAESCKHEVVNVKSEMGDLQAIVAAKEAQVKDLEGQVMDAEQVRRKLHNQIQELRGNVRVFCRVRPQAAEANSSVMCLQDGASVKVEAPPQGPVGPSTANSLNANGLKEFNFGFDRVFNNESSQGEIFEEVSQLVQSALDGYKVCLFSYGQTGSGKTYTMLGDQGANVGIIPRSVEKVVQTAEALKSKGWEYSMEACYIEIYNEGIRDLLQPGTAHSDTYSIKHNPSGCPTVNNVTREPVPNVAAAADLVRRAAAVRTVEATQMNSQSSRSHTLFMLYITGVHAAAGQKLEGCLNLVDLAGSERVNRSGAEGDRLKEACSINKSLSSLGDVFQAISSNQKHIPYRNSKLTHLLAPCLGGDGKTLMFVNIAPEESHSEESLCSLRFASKVNACELGARGTGAKRNISSVDPEDGIEPKADTKAPAARKPPSRRSTMAPRGTSRTVTGRPSTAGVRKPRPSSAF